MRLFIAVDLDDRSRAAVAAAQTRVRAAAVGASPLRWVRPAHLHLTLIFLGEVAAERSPSIVEAIARPAQQHGFELVFAGLGVFPARGAPRALWVGASAGARELAALHQE